MDPVASAVERIKGFATSSVGFVKGAFQWHSHSSHNHPLEILKRLQREAFSDLMKLRDRQDKVEHTLSFYKSGNGSPFQEARTHIKGFVDVAGALLFAETDDQQAFDTLDRAGVRTGIDSRFIFETTLRQKDALMAEFVCTQNSLRCDGDVFGSPLALAKVMYLANINDCLSVASIPLGARCSDFGIGSGFVQGRRFSRLSSFVPSLFNQYHSSGAGLIVEGSNIVASLAELVSGLGMQPGNMSWLSTFCQVNYQPFEEARLALSGVWKIPRSSSYLSKLGTLAIPLRSLKRQTKSAAQVQESSAPAGSFALMLESELDERTNIGGWVEVQKLSPSLFQWGFSLSDTPEDELGWGLRLGGNVDDGLNQFQLEGFLNFNLGKRVSLQPGLVFATNGRTRTPALVFRSSWSM